MADGTMPLLRMENISKSYGGVRALQDVQFTAERGRIHALLGENGAGKSTLIKVLSGVVRPDAGTILLDGQPMQFASPYAANAAAMRDAARVEATLLAAELSGRMASVTAQLGKGVEELMELPEQPEPPRLEARFRCEDCGVGSVTWHWRCPGCRSWDSLQSVQIRAH